MGGLQTFQATDKSDARKTICSVSKINYTSFMNLVLNPFNSSKHMNTKQ